MIVVQQLFRVRFSAVVFSILASLTFSPLGLGDENPTGRASHAPPFDHGENVVYQASWNGIPVASSEVRLTPVFRGGRKFYDVKVEAKTWKYLDLFWKMRDSVESVIDAKTLQPERFVFRQRENHRKVDTTAEYDSRQHRWSVKQEGGKKNQRFEFISDKTFDPVSATYFARAQEIEVGKTIVMEVFGGKNRYRVELNIVGKEKIRTKLGEHEAFKIIPKVTNLSRDGVADKMRQATVWITADHERKPLRIMSHVTIGNVYVDLVEEKN